MKIRFTFILLVLAVVTAMGQTRIFLSGGGSFLTTYAQNEYFYPKYGNSVHKTDGSYTAGGLRYFTFDLEIEKRIGRFSAVSGVRLFNSGYSNHYLSDYSTLNCSHIGVPLLFRLNLLNYIYFDLGAIGVYTASAILDESAFKGSPSQVSARTDIARYMPFRIGFNLQMSIVINRYFISGYFIVLGGQVSNSFAANYHLGPYSGNSLFLRDLNPRYGLDVMGLKVGMRIR